MALVEEVADVEKTVALAPVKKDVAVLALIVVVLACMVVWFGSIGA